MRTFGLSRSCMLQSGWAYLIGGWAKSAPGTTFQSRREAGGQNGSTATLSVGFLCHPVWEARRRSRFIRRTVHRNRVSR